MFPNKIELFFFIAILMFVGPSMNGKKAYDVFFVSQ